MPDPWQFMAADGKKNCDAALITALAAGGSVAGAATHAKVPVHGVKMIGSFVKRTKDFSNSGRSFMPSSSAVTVSRSALNSAGA
jgi:hypothetical protein